MLKDDFFTIKEVTATETGRTFRVVPNVSHPIFQAHFAGNPVMPGACIVQMIKELATDDADAPFFIRTVKNMKFLRVINPQETPELSVQLTCTPYEEGALSVSALISDGDRIFSKATLLLTPRQ
jgi:3-hydroxyacyl-[acyl-carrier-protein] dehydratase